MAGNGAADTLAPLPPARTRWDLARSFVREPPIEPYHVAAPPIEVAASSTVEAEPWIVPEAAEPELAESAVAEVEPVAAEPVSGALESISAVAELPELEAVSEPSWQLEPEDEPRHDEVLQEIAMSAADPALTMTEAADEHQLSLMTPVELEPEPEVELESHAVEPAGFAQLARLTDSPQQVLADRFERLSQRLRAEDVSTLLPALAHGDRFDAILAGFLAGYLAAKDD